MFHSRLNQKQILFGAEIDGVANNYPLSADTFCTDAKFVEVKTHRHITTEGHDNIFKKKALRWYCQSYLVGIEDLYVGFRNQSGIVGNIAVYKVPGLPVICAVSIYYCYFVTHYSNDLLLDRANGTDMNA